MVWKSPWKFCSFSERPKMIRLKFYEDFFVNVSLRKFLKYQRYLLLNNLFPSSLSCFGSFFLCSVYFCNHMQHSLIGVLPQEFIFSVDVPSFNELKHEYSCTMLTMSNLVANMLREITVYKLLWKPVHKFSLNFPRRFFDQLLLQKDSISSFYKQTLCGFCQDISDQHNWIRLRTEIWNSAFLQQRKKLS